MRPREVATLADVAYPKTVRAGERFTYVATIRNKSAFRAPNAFVHFSFSGALYIENATGIGWSCNNGIIYSKDATKICRRDFIPAGETTTVSLEVSAPMALGEFENNIFVSSDDLYDSNVEDNYLATKILVQ